MRPKNFLITGGAAILLFLSVAIGEVVTASSDPFTFPSFPGVKYPQLTVNGLYLKFQGVSSAAHTINLAWSVPATIGAKNGSISLYTLQGKIVATAIITGQRGLVTLKTQGKQGVNGILLAKMVYGSRTLHSKLVVCR
jgi:hypothetical protein